MPKRASRRFFDDLNSLFLTFSSIINNFIIGEVKNLKLRIVGSHPLWAHFVWNAAKVMSDYVDAPEFKVEDKNVLELGAGVALPSLICVLNKARHVVATDYPDHDLIENIAFNIDNNIPLELRSRARSAGFLWGTDIKPLLELAGGSKFDVVILSDVIFNHNCQEDLLKTCKEALSEKGQVLVSFSHHKPNRAHLDLRFFELAEKQFGFKVEKKFSLLMKPMFEKDFGDESMRATVQFYVLTM